MNQKEFEGISEVKTLTFPELFSNEHGRFPLALDTYQRPYVWSQQKVAQLRDDLRDFIADKTRKVDYYVGTLLLHRNVARRTTFVIDGQQRLTTLLILHYVLTRRMPDGQDFKFSSPLSERNIRAARKVLDEEKKSLPAGALFQRIRFTVVVVTAEDLAFTFFDTQNHRGVPLAATDLLKAYHLRAITGPDGETLQTDCAERWERMQRLRRIDGYEVDLAPLLFEKLLWRARRWRGQGRMSTETHDEIIDEFQTRSLRPPSPEAVPLYPARLNTLASSLSLAAGGRLRLDLQGLGLGGEAIDLPFSMRQPVSRGLGFFLYADKYAALSESLLLSRDAAPAPAFRDFYHAVIAGGSVYLREFFVLASTMFADRFGHGALYAFGLWLDYVLGAIRMEKHYIFEAAPRVYLRESSQNLLDLIATAYMPEEVIDFLKNDPNADRIYAADEPKGHTGVRGAYRQRVLKYFGKKGSVAGKRAWILDRIRSA